MPEAVTLLQVHPSVVSKRLVRGELVEPLQRASIVELFRPALDVMAYDLMFGVGLGREFRLRNGKIDPPRCPLSAKSGRSLPCIKKFLRALCNFGGHRVSSDALFSAAIAVA